MKREGWKERLRRRWSGCTVRTRVVVTCGVLLMGAFLVSSGTLVNIRSRALKRTLVERLSLEAEIAAANVSASMRVGSREGVLVTLYSMTMDPSIMGVRVTDNRGGEFAALGEQKPSVGDETVHESGRLSIWDESFTVSTPVRFDGKLLGEVRIKASSSDLTAALIEMVITFLAVNLMVLLAALWLLKRLADLAMEPVAQLAVTAQRVADRGDYALRAEKGADDEVGTLVESFNRVLATVEEQQRQLEEQHARLARAKRLESLGLLAGGVAHDLNNILGPMVALPDLVAEKMAPGDDRRELLGVMGKSARRASVVIRDLLSLTRRGTYPLGCVALEELVEACVTGEVFTERMRECGGGVKVRLTTERDEGDDLLVEGSEAHLMQVVMNLAINAAEAMQGNGELWVRCGRRVFEEPRMAYEMIPEGEYVVLTVEDTGPGIPEDALEHLFEPFFTKKSMGSTSGTGLGLAVVYGVVRDHGGYLNVRSKPGRGAIFDIYLKPYCGVVEAREGGDPKVSLRSAKVLVVDDYDHQRTLTTKLLEASGHRVKQAPSGRKALELLREERFDLMVVDMIMEDGFDGLDTIRGAMEVQPTLRCIIATGFSDTDRVQEAMVIGACSCLSKPYTREALERAVGEAMVGGARVVLAS